MTERLCQRTGCGVPLTRRQRTFCSRRCSGTKGRRPMCGHTAQWPPERVLHLMGLWDDGLSASDIGLRMGMSKNSVIGKVHRLKLIPRPSPLHPKSDTPRVPRLATAGGAKRTNGYTMTGQTLAPLSSLARKAPPSMPTRHTPSIVPVRPPPPQRTPEPRAPQPNGPARQCAFLTGDKPNWRQCEAVAQPGSVYCPDHHRLCYIRPRDRREDYVLGRVAA